MPKNKAPFHMHALVKASAKHLLNHGHIDKATHQKIVAHAERGMAKNPRMPKAASQYEGSPEDMQEDAAGAQSAGMSPGAYENSPMDKAQDAAGQRRMGKRK